MNRKVLAVACLMLVAMTGCVGRVYTETYAEPRPVVVHRTVVVDARRPHYHRRHYYRRPVVVSPRPAATSGTHVGIRADTDGNVRLEASAR